MATNNNSAPARIADISAEITESGLLHISFGASANTITVDPAALSDAIRAQATLHGLKQKMVDAAAIARDTTTGRSATPADKEAAVMEVYNRITTPEGTWNKVREAGASAIGGMLVAALMEMTGKDKPAILEYLSKKSNEEKAALRKNQKVAEIILKLQAANVNPAIDTDSMLDDIMHIGAADDDAETGPHANDESHADAHAHKKSRKTSHAAA